MLQFPIRGQHRRRVRAKGRRRLDRSPQIELVREIVASSSPSPQLSLTYHYQLIFNSTRQAKLLRQRRHAKLEEPSLGFCHSPYLGRYLSEFRTVETGALR